MDCEYSSLSKTLLSLLQALRLSSALLRTSSSVRSSSRLLLSNFFTWSSSWAFSRSNLATSSFSNHLSLSSLCPETPSSIVTLLLSCLSITSMICLNSSFSCAKRATSCLYNSLLLTSSVELAMKENPCPLEDSPVFPICVTPTATELILVCTADLSCPNWALRWLFSSLSVRSSSSYFERLRESSDNFSSKYTFWSNS